MAVFLCLLVVTLHPMTCLQTRAYSLSTVETNTSSKSFGKSKSYVSTTDPADSWTIQTARKSTSTLQTYQSVDNVFDYTENNTLSNRSLSGTLGGTYTHPSSDVPIGRTTIGNSSNVVTDGMRGNESVKSLAGRTESYSDAEAVLDHTYTSQSSLGVTGDYTESKETVSGVESDKTVHSKVTEVIKSTSNHPTTPAPVVKPYIWTTLKNDHKNLRFNIGPCFNYYTFPLTTSYNLTVELLVDPDQIKKPVVECGLTISVIPEHYINLTVDQLTDTFDGNFTLNISEVSKYETPSPLVIDSVMLKHSSVFWASFTRIKFSFKSHAPYTRFVLKLHYRVQEGPYWRTLPSSNISADVSFVTSPGFLDGQFYPHHYDGEFVITISAGESLLISFSQIYISYSHDCVRDYLWLIELPQKKKRKLCGNPKTDVEIYQSSIGLQFHTDEKYTSGGFKMMFSILPRSEEPKLLPGKLFNCSVPHFHRFKPLISCNTLVECEGGEDEQECSFDSRDCGKGFVSGNTKCYRVVRSTELVTWTDAKYDCIRHGQKLVTFKTSEEYEEYKRLLLLAKNLNYNFFGAQTLTRPQAISMATLYKFVWQWVDGGTAFSIQMSHYRLPPTCGLYNRQYHTFMSMSCNEKSNNDYVCEFDKPGRIPHVETVAQHNVDLFVHSENVTWRTELELVECLLGHVTRDFFSCDLQAECRAPDYHKFCVVGVVKVPMFECGHSQSSLPYTLVCDHVQHCLDNSDEDFCLHPECPYGFSRDGQCIFDRQLCDGKLDCYDGSDETCQTVPSGTRSTGYPPGSVHFDGIGGSWVKGMKGNEHCPSTYFLCPNDFCLPRYLRCNGIVDCPGREDEAGCDSYTCPGLYRCRGSKVCLHADNVCDGVPQCPEQDDELLCDFSCPDQCHCQGLAFVCSTNFSVSSYPALRYLNAGGSGMTPEAFNGSLFLINLDLSNCGVDTVPLNMYVPNLQEFGLRQNNLTSIDMQRFHYLPNLRVLILARNPLVTIIDSAYPEIKAMKLQNIDLSHTDLEVLNGSAFINNPGLKVLNVSWTKVTTITVDGLQSTPKLESVDFRGSPLRHYPNDLLKNLNFLRLVQADSYKLCCEAMLPIGFNLHNCYADQELLASCEDLLRSNIYRVSLWIFASLSILGNIGNFAARLYLNTEGISQCSFSVFVTNLSIADFLMGVYLAVIGGADLFYHGKYMWFDDAWKNSVVCKTAGFMSLLSSEVSAFMICVITLDRFLVLRFPFSRLHFSRRSAMITCGVVWLVGIILAAIPLLPMTSHWEFYSQTGICIPLPFTVREGFQGYDYSFSVMILLNFVMFVLIAIGQAGIYWSIRIHSISSSTSKSSKDATIARRLTTIVVSDFMCWFPIGLLGVLAATGTPIPGEVNVAVAIFVLPLNSAINPFLYTFNVIMEKRKKAKEALLLKRLECRMLTLASRVTE